MKSEMQGGQSEYTVVRLDNGLRMVHVARASVAEIFGIAARVGSRDELPGEYGLAHFVEHTIFKGTASRRSSSIINCMETVGGELNAYTTKEETYVYSVFPTGNAGRAVKLIADLVTNSIFPDSELDKEREVVAEEIDSYLDTPSEAVFDDFEDEIFAGTPLGHNILGNTADLARFNSEVCRRFLHSHYYAANMVAFYIGSESVAKIAAQLERNMREMPLLQAADGVSSSAVKNVSMPLSAAVGPLAVAAPFDKEKGDGSNHQGHTVMGAVIPSLYSPDRQTIALINNILGGPGMNSRLNVSLRERRGLVYSVESSLAMYSDCGLMTVYFGCNPEDTAKCKRLVMNELQRIVDNVITDSALHRARRQYIGQMTVASASSEQTILSAARSMLFRNKVVTPSDIASQIEAVTASGLRDVAAAYLSPALFSSLTMI